MPIPIVFPYLYVMAWPSATISGAWCVAYAINRTTDGIVLAWKYYNDQSHTWTDNIRECSHFSRVLAENTALEISRQLTVMQGESID